MTSISPRPQISTSQSGVSKQIRELEIELGIEIFVRKGKRLTGLTRAGEGAVKLIGGAGGSRNLKRLSASSRARMGRLVIKHNQARYALSDVVVAFTQEFPNVQLELRQGTPKQAAANVLKGEADLAIATEALDQYSDLHLPAFHGAMSWSCRAGTSWRVHHDAAGCGGASDHHLQPGILRPRVIDAAFRAAQRGRHPHDGDGCGCDRAYVERRRCRDRVRDGGRRAMR
jgi:DNA-binding transcriptional LysR family regulator